MGRGVLLTWISDVLLVGFTLVVSRGRNTPTGETVRYTSSIVKKKADFISVKFARRWLPNRRYTSFK